MAIEPRPRRLTFPKAKAVVAALLPITQTIVSLYSDQTLSEGELKLIGAELFAALLVYLTPAPGYAAPGERAVPKEVAENAGYYGAHEDRDRDGVPDKVELEQNQPSRGVSRAKDRPVGGYTGKDLP